VTDRRAFLGMLAGAAAATLAACDRAATSSGAGASGSPTVPPASVPPSSAAPSSAAASPSPTTQALPASSRWVPRSGEVEPQVKEVATGLVQAVATWPTGQSGLPAARARVAALGQDAALADACAPLVGTEVAASSRIVDAQYGGILSSTSSVLVVLDQWRLGRDGVVRPGGTTLDVRLARSGSRWRVVDVFPARPGHAASSPPALARQVLGDARIRLPYAAHADVATGLIASSVLTTLLALAQHWLVDVSVVRSGHPFFVFGTNRPSDHPKGHAVDVWALDGNALVQPPHHALAVSGMRLAVAHGAYNVGGPVLLSGPQYFSDRTHQDHIHLGFRH
jgi:hypothetical protein